MNKKLQIVLSEATWVSAIYPVFGAVLLPLAGLAQGRLLNLALLAPVGMLIIALRRQAAPAESLASVRLLLLATLPVFLLTPGEEQLAAKIILSVMTVLIALGGAVFSAFDKRTGWLISIAVGLAFGALAGWAVDEVALQMVVWTLPAALLMRLAPYAAALVRNTLTRGVQVGA